MRILQRARLMVAMVFVVGPAGCARKPAAEAPAPDEALSKVGLVAPTERSGHFEAVQSRLELGGAFYAYADVDGDVLKLADVLQRGLAQVAERQPMVAPFLPEDLAPVFRDLGLDDVKAIGLSSVADPAGGFRNRLFLHTPDGRHGLLAGLGGPAASFLAPTLVPADADFVFETEMDLAAVYAALRAVVVRVAGEPLAESLEARLKAVDADTGLVPHDVIQQAKGRVTFALRIDATREIRTPQVVLPEFDLLLRLEGVGASLDTVLQKSPIKRTVAPDGVITYEIATPRSLVPWTPVVTIEGAVATLITRPNLGGGPARLAADPAFRALLAEVGDKGNGLSYAGPRLDEKLARLLALNPKLPEQQKKGVEALVNLFSTGGGSLVSVRTNEPDGVLVRSRWSSSHKGTVFLANPGVVVVGTGLAAAMAIPAFQKVRANAQEKTVLNNLRQLSAARDQFLLETGRNSCTYADLVGPGKLIRELKPVMGEDYSRILFVQDRPIVLRLKNGRELRVD